MKQIMKISIEQPNAKGNYQVIKFDGEFDKAGYSAVKDQLKDVVEGLEVKFLVFDFGSLTFINSEAIGYIMDLHNYLQKSDKALAIVSVKENVKDVLDAIGMDEVVKIYGSLDAFTKR